MVTDLHSHTVLSDGTLVPAEWARLAKDKGMTLEITARKGYGLANGHVARKAPEFGIPLVVNSDGHEPADLLTRELWRAVALGAGLEERLWPTIVENCIALVKRLGFALHQAGR